MKLITPRAQRLTGHAGSIARLLKYAARAAESCPKARKKNPVQFRASALRGSSASARSRAAVTPSSVRGERKLLALAVANQASDTVESCSRGRFASAIARARMLSNGRSEEHTSELQSP